MHHKNPSKSLEKIKGCDPSTFPPCKSVLSETFKRANYVAFFFFLSKEHHIEIHSHEIRYMMDRDSKKETDYQVV